MRRVKGFSIGTVVLILAIAVGVVGLVYLIGRGLGLGGGKGNGEGEGNAETLQAMATVQTTEMTTQKIACIGVTVSENKYIFNNKTYEIEEIDSMISDMKINLDNFTVEITDDYASAKAYDELISSLKNAEIEFVEINGEGE